MNKYKITIETLEIGGAKISNNYANHLNANIVICHKERRVANQVENMMLIGDVQDRNVVLLDDMIDTAGTLVKASELIMSKGAKSVRGIATHPVLSGNEYDGIGISPV